MVAALAAATIRSRAHAAPATSSSKPAGMSRRVRAAAVVDSGSPRRPEALRTGSRGTLKSSTWSAFGCRMASSGGWPRCSIRGAASAVGMAWARIGPRSWRAASTPDEPTDSADAVTRDPSSSVESTGSDAVVVRTRVARLTAGAERWDGAMGGADRTRASGPIRSVGVLPTRSGVDAGPPGTADGDPAIGSGVAGTAWGTSSGPASGATSVATTGCAGVRSEPSATRGGRNPRGSRYPSATLARRTPRCTYGTGCSLSPLGPALPTTSPSATRDPRATSDEPR